MKGRAGWMEEGEWWKGRGVVGEWGGGGEEYKEMTVYIE